MANPNPACEVKNSAAAYVAAAGGVNITPAATVIIRLSSQADVDSWLCDCITTDDSSDAATVTASLVIDSTLKTATFTAPAAGKAYRFRSRVNGGIDRNGVAQASYTTTFCVYTVINGRHVMAADETTEGDTTFGWTKWQNDIIRSVPSGTGSWAAGGGGAAVGANYQFQYYNGGSFAGATGFDYVPTTGVVSINRGLIALGTAVATLASAALVGGTAATGFALVQPLLAAPVIGGTTVFTGLDIVAKGLTDHQPISVVRSISTSDATVTPVFAWKILDEAVSSVCVEINAVASGGSAGGSYARRVSIMSDGGVATYGAPESSWNDEHTATGVGFTGISIGSGIWIGASGATGFINVKGTPTGRIKWGATISVIPTSWA